MISVVIPLYNKEKQIINTLQSVFRQTYQDFEIVVINDGSTDNSVAEVERIQDPRIRLINQQNTGVSVARNRGIQESKGEYIALLDGDDEWMPDYLKTQIELAQKYPECDVYAVNYCFRDMTGQTIPTKINQLPFIGADGILANYFEVASCSHPPICSISIMVRKGVFESVGGFPIGIKSGEDLLTWARLACKYKIAYSTKPLAFFVESASDSNESKAIQRSGGEQYVLDELLKLYSTHPDIVGLKDYVIRWYKIYCVLSIEINNNHKILKLAPEAIKFGGSKLQFMLLYIFGLMPTAISKYLFFKLRR